MTPLTILNNLQPHNLPKLRKMMSELISCNF